MLFWLLPASADAGSPDLLPKIVRSRQDDGKPGADEYFERPLPFEHDPMIAIHNDGMNNQRLEQLIKTIGTITDGQLGFWRFDYEGRELVAMADEHHNRMRVMTAVATEEDLSEAEVRTLLGANFDRALDAKYATSQGILWSVFMHPLREVGEEQFLDAVAQVKTLADNFGTSYSSSTLVFGGD